MSELKTLHSGPKSADFAQKYRALCIAWIPVWFSAAKGVLTQYTGPVEMWIAGLVSGPIPAALLRFDITDKQLETAWLALILPYWICLGTGVGYLHWLHWNARVGTPDAEKITLMDQNLGRLRLAVVVLVLILGLASMLSLPSHVGGGSPPAVTVVNNLRRIDGAKQQLALEKKLPPAYVPAESELASYLARSSFHIATNGPLRYVMNPIDTAPYAVLISDWRIKRRGWHEGYTIPKGTVYHIE